MPGPNLGVGQRVFSVDVLLVIGNVHKIIFYSKDYFDFGLKKKIEKNCSKIVDLILKKYCGPR